MSRSVPERQRGRAAFTLTELLVVFAIVAILFALLLSAVQQVRSSAQRLSCQNNLKQLGLALHGYHSAHQCFPTGAYNYFDAYGPNDYDRRTWLMPILPYLEQEGMYEAYVDKMTNRFGYYSYDGFVYVRSVLPTLLCPSDPSNPKTVTGGTTYPPTTNQQGFHSNYVLCAGNATFYTGTNYTESARLNGLFYPFSMTRGADVTDGLTNTVMGSELIVVPDTSAEDTRGRVHNAMHGGSFFTTLYPPNTPQPDREGYCENTLPQAPCIDSPTDAVSSARSYHTGGVNSLFADGSVHFMANGLNLTIWNALGSRNGGEPYTSGF